MKIWTSEHTFKHPWDTVVQAAWRKYPNPLNPNVTGLDVIDRKVDEKGLLHSHRLMTTQWGLPDWAIRLVGMEKHCYVSEHSTVDSEKCVMTLKSRNVSFSNFVTIDEQLVYSQHPTDPQSTVLSQEAVISVKGVPLTSYMESLIEGTCSGNAQQGRQALEWVISSIKTEAKIMSQDFQRVSHAAAASVEDLMTQSKSPVS